MLNVLAFIFLLLAILGFIALIIGLVKPELVIKWGVKKTRARAALIYVTTAFGSLILFMIFVIMSGTPENPDTVQKQQNAAEQVIKEVSNIDQEAKEEIVKSISWEDKIKEVASSSKNETEKFDEISKYAKDYKPTNDEVTRFENDIIKEYKDKKYIMDLSNHEYMLGNIFKSQVVSQSSQEQTMKNFAFDFFQNSKYNYRGVENMTSASTLANERQMDKALNTMGK